jgi:dual specificity phosphatase, catalytic domain
MKIEICNAEQAFYKMHFENTFLKGKYIVISIRSTPSPITFTETDYLKGSLILQFADIEPSWVEENGGVEFLKDKTDVPLIVFSEEMAKQIIQFVQDHQDVETILVHCDAGVSRSRAVGAYLDWIFNSKRDQVSYRLRRGNIEFFDILNKVGQDQFGLPGFQRAFPKYIPVYRDEDVYGNPHHFKLDGVLELKL